MRLEFSRQIFGKSSNIKFHQNPSSGSRVAPCGRTDRRRDGHDEANNSFLQHCKRAKNSTHKAVEILAIISTPTREEFRNLTNPEIRVEISGFIHILIEIIEPDLEHSPLFGS
jgi:hypothetical protein